MIANHLHRIPGIARTRSRTATLPALLAVALMLAACADDATEGAQAETTSQAETSVAQSAVPTTELPLVDAPPLVEAEAPPFPEPHLDVEVESEDIPENPAAEPIEVLLNADPEDDGAEPVVLGPGESALCATIQIGFDATTDGDRALARTQRATLIDRWDSLADPQLIDLVADIERAPIAEEASFEAALNRCESLGFES